MNALLENIVVRNQSFRRPEEFENEGFWVLVNNIKECGMREPLTVLELTAGKFELVNGFRRYRAAKECGLNEVPIIILKPETS